MTAAIRFASLLLWISAVGLGVPCLMASGASQRVVASRASSAFQRTVVIISSDAA